MLQRRTIKKFDPEETHFVIIDGEDPGKTRAVVMEAVIAGWAPDGTSPYLEIIVSILFCI